MIKNYLIIIVCLISLKGFSSEKPLFSIPKQLSLRVNFWINIYAQYNSWELVVHDVKYPQFIYKVIDNKDLFSNKKLSYQKRKWLINRRYQKEKIKIRKLLKALDKGHKTNSADPLVRVIQKYFSTIKDSDKYARAGEHKRVRSQSGLRDSFIKGIFHSGRYMPKIIEMLLGMDLPKQLAYLPFVESGFNEQAMSKVGASGLWQLMPTTGRFYLRVDKIVDERNDPLKSARAAAKLLKENFAALKSWPLAITAYNHGRAGIKRAVRDTGSREIFDIIDQYHGPSFGFASANFYSSFLAAVKVVENRGEYFGKVPLSEPLKFDNFIMTDFVDINTLSKFLKIKIEILKELNPGLTTAVYKGKKLVPVGYLLRVPLGEQDKFLQNYAAIPQELKKQRQIDHKKKLKNTDIDTDVSSEL